MKNICSEFGKTRQAYYRHRSICERRKKEEEMILDKVREYRLEQPYVGGRKIKKMLQQDNIIVGRDRLFSFLRNNDLLVKKKRKSRRTTNSLHRFYCYKNLIKDLEITRPNQVFVSDITYIRTLHSFQYLFLITDYHSRKIVGYDVSDSLAIDGGIRALKMALKDVDDKGELIHHSDRGIQYCSNAYTDLLKQKGVQISMTEEDHVYENALAERVNGILKEEFCLGETIVSKEVVELLVKDAIQTYNRKRLHMSLNYKTPESVYAA